MCLIFTLKFEVLDRTIPEKLDAWKILGDNKMAVVSHYSAVIQAAWPHKLLATRPFILYFAPRCWSFMKGIHQPIKSGEYCQKMSFCMNASITESLEKLKPRSTSRGISANLLPLQLLKLWLVFITYNMWLSQRTFCLNCNGKDRKKYSQWRAVSDGI